MQHVILLLLLVGPSLTSSRLPEVQVEVIVNSSSCSVTCGVGLRSQSLCLMNNSEAALEEGVKGGAEVSGQCRVRKVKCQESWQCGLRTITVTDGQRAELDCVGEVMEAMGRFSWRVSWRLARGIISSDDSLFARWEAPQLDRVTFNPVREEHAGTYRCDVQDNTFRRVKRVYWGVRVLPSGLFNLDYETSLDQWTRDKQQQAVSDQQYHRTSLPLMMLISLISAGSGVTLILLALHWMVLRRRRKHTPKEPENL